MTDPSQALRLAGLRVTPARRAVLQALQAFPHSDTETVLREARSRLHSVSHQAIYDVLRVLTDTGLVRRIQPAGSLARYEVRVGDNHHHLVCRSCGVIADVACAVGETPCLTPAEDNGFIVNEAEVVYWGYCPTCAAAARTAATTPLEEQSSDQPLQLNGRGTT